jgi:hypothetical protein
VRPAVAAGTIDTVEHDTRFCPGCGRPVELPTARWQAVVCEPCDRRFYTWDLSRWPRLPLAFLPILWVWAIFPALLLLTGLLWPNPGPDSTDTPIGAVFTNVAVHGGPPMLYAWSVYLLYYRGVRWFGLVAIPHAAVLVILNAALALGLLPVLLPLVG